jgi:hypothetical protein
MSAVAWVRGGGGCNRPRKFTRRVVKAAGGPGPGPQQSLNPVVIAVTCGFGPLGRFFRQLTNIPFSSFPWFLK